MSMIVLEHQVQMTVMVTDIESIEAVKAEIEKFANRIKPTDQFSIMVTMVIGQAASAKYAEEPEVETPQTLAIKAFEAGLGKVNFRDWCKTNGLQRSSWHNWKNGHCTISSLSLKKLVALAPNEGVRNLLLSVR